MTRLSDRQRRAIVAICENGIGRHYRRFWIGGVDVDIIEDATHVTVAVTIRTDDHTTIGAKVRDTHEAYVSEAGTGTYELVRDLYLMIASLPLIGGRPVRRRRPC